MPRIPTVSARQLIKVLKKDGFIHVRTEGSHWILYHSQKGITVSVPVHKGRDLGRGITQAILKDTRINAEEFLRLL